MESGRIALVLVASGGIGGETALALSRHGWKIRALSRTGRNAGDSRGWDRVKGDALARDSIVAAAEGADTIVHAVNPPAYKIGPLWSSQRLRTPSQRRRRVVRASCSPALSTTTDLTHFPYFAKTLHSTQQRTRELSALSLRSGCKRLSRTACIL